MVFRSLVIALTALILSTSVNALSFNALSSSEGVNLENNTTRVEYDGSNTSGVADFGLLKAKSDSFGTLATGIDSISVGSFYSIYVDSGGPVPEGGGNNIGDIVEIKFDFRIDGNLSVNFIPSIPIQNGPLGIASFQASFVIGFDLNYPLCVVDPISSPCNNINTLSDPSRFHELILFDASGLSSRMPKENEPDTIETTSSSNWQLITYPLGASTVIGDGFAAPVREQNFDTGIVSTTIEVPIGVKLDVLTALSVSSDISGSTDFYNTFGLVAAPVTEGVEFSYGDIIPATFDLGGGTTVPIPSAVWLFGSGFIGLIGVARRKKV